MNLAIHRDQFGRTGGLVTRPFLVALIVLGFAAVIVGPVARRLDFRHAKAALPVRKALGSMEVSSLAPYRVLHRQQLQTVVVEALGTDQYVSWTLEDTSTGPNDPLHIAELFITYDTGGQNLVPHTPDECRLGAGYEPARAHENTVVRLNPSESGTTEAPIRVCTFVKTAVFNREEATVIYLFHSNGRFAATREAVRLLFHDPRDHFGYFSKVEICFPKATREQSVAGVGKLLSRLLPVLMRDHWPDFEAAEKSARGDDATTDRLSRQPDVD